MLEQRDITIVKQIYTFSGYILICPLNTKRCVRFIYPVYGLIKICLYVLVIASPVMEYLDDNCKGASTFVKIADFERIGNHISMTLFGLVTLYDSLQYKTQWNIMFKNFEVVDLVLIPSKTRIFGVVIRLIYVHALFVILAYLGWFLDYDLDRYRGYYKFARYCTYYVRYQVYIEIMLVIEICAMVTRRYNILRDMLRDITIECRNLFGMDLYLHGDISVVKVSSIRTNKKILKEIEKIRSAFDILDEIVQQVNTIFGKTLLMIFLKLFIGTLCCCHLLSGLMFGRIAIYCALYALNYWVSKCVLYRVKTFKI